MDEHNKEITYTVVKLEFAKKLKLKQLAVGLNLTIQELINKLVDLVLEDKSILNQKPKKDKKPIVKEEPKLSEKEISELYDLFEEEE